jgi:hypothetical protein
VFYSPYHWRWAGFRPRARLIRRTEASSLPSGGFFLVLAHRGIVLPYRVFLARRSVPPVPRPSPRPWLILGLRRLQPFFTLLASNRVVDQAYSAGYLFRLHLAPKKSLRRDHHRYGVLLFFFARFFETLLGGGTGLAIRGFRARFSTLLSRLVKHPGVHLARIIWLPYAQPPGEPGRLGAIKRRIRRRIQGD